MHICIMIVFNYVITCCLLHRSPGSLGSGMDCTLKMKQGWIVKETAMYSTLALLCTEIRRHAESETWHGREERMCG